MFGFLAQSKVSARADAGIRLGLICLASVTVLLALRNVGPEFAAHKSSVDGPLGLYRDNAKDLAPAVGSMEGTYDRLFACDAALTDLTSLLQPKANRLEVARACLTMADATLQTAPSLAFAYVVKAQALRELAQLTEVRAALLLSEVTGGVNVQYAQRRAAMWIDQISALNKDEQAALRRDLHRVGVSATGLAWIAGQYARNVELRPLITQTIETLPENQQKAFLSSVRALTK